MKTAKITSLPSDSFMELLQTRRIFIIYPWLQFRNIFLTYFMDRDQDIILYHRVEGEDLSIRDFVQELIEEQRTNHEDFGTHALDHLDKSPEELGHALARDVAEIPAGDLRILYLDEFDRLSITPEFINFSDALARNLSDDSRLVINARVATYEPWASLVKEQLATVLGTANRKDDVMYAVSDDVKPQLEIYAFGRGHALVNGQQIENWDGALPRNLFFYFVDNELLTRDQIFEVFWPNLSIKEATNVFHVTKRKITECISDQVMDDENYELTQYGNGFYSPSNKVVRHYDVAEFEDAVEKASMTFNDEEQGKLYKRAIEIYKGHFLQDLDMPWVVERREKLQLLFVEALIGMARLHKSAEDYETALGFFVRALREQPQREDIHREVMKLYNRLGRIDDALAQYNTLEQQLQDTLGVAPDKATTELYHQIKATAV
jgi:two-component SAPR family response regulator